jgi:hypothetical protein
MMVVLLRNSASAVGFGRAGKYAAHQLQGEIIKKSDSYVPISARSCHFPQMFAVVVRRKICYHVLTTLGDEWFAMSAA